MARQGEFGSIYEGLDSQKMFEWMLQYVVIKSEAREKAKRKEQDAYKAVNEDGTLLSTMQVKRSYEKMKSGVFEEANQSGRSSNRKADDEEFRKFKNSYYANKKISP